MKTREHKKKKWHTVGIYDRFWMTAFEIRSNFAYVMPTTFDFMRCRFIPREKEAGLLETVGQSIRIKQVELYASIIFL